MKHVKQLLSALLVLAVVLSLLPAGVLKASAAEAPAALDIGYPTFKNTELLNEVYDLSKLGVSYSEKDIMMAIYKQDLANGGDSFRLAGGRGAAALSGIAREKGIRWFLRTPRYLPREGKMPRCFFF